MALNVAALNERLWNAADQLRANSNLKSSEYAVPVLGLIFLRYADQRFQHVHADLTAKAQAAGSRRSIGKADYHARGVLYLPEAAQFAHLLNLPEGSDLGKAINDAMKAVEAENEELSKQAFGIVPLVRVVDQVMTPALQLRVREGHPELSFADMAGGSPVMSKKKRTAGREERLSLLEVHFPDVRAVVAAFRPGDARVDAVDAYAMLWTARRWRAGEAVVIPERPPLDPTGLRVEMIV